MNDRNPILRAEAWADKTYERAQGSYPNRDWLQQRDSFLAGWEAAVREAEASVRKLYISADQLTAPGFG